VVGCWPADHRRVPGIRPRRRISLIQSPVERTEKASPALDRRGFFGGARGRPTAASPPG
jgi:hypothetical protein